MSESEAQLTTAENLGFFKAGFFAAKSERLVIDSGELIERCARAAYDQAFLKHAPTEVDRWDDLAADDDPSAESWREVARAVVDEAFAHLCTQEPAAEVEWGVKVPTVGAVRVSRSEAEARADVAWWARVNDPNPNATKFPRVLVKRTRATEWQEVPRSAHYDGGVEPDREVGGVTCSTCGWHLGGLFAASDVQSRMHAEAYPNLEGSES